MLETNRLLQELEQLLRPDEFQDYAPNGLQLAGTSKIKKIVSGVTACYEFLQRAIAEQADAVLVHHGFFWKGESQPIVGLKHQRFKLILENDLNVIAYHLPLDAHPTLGNNSELARILDIEITGGLENKTNSIGLVGRFTQPISGNELSERITAKLNRKPLHIPAEKTISTIAWCTGGAQSMISQALEHNVDAYITGEVSEPTVHIAREAGMHFFAAGHHATERYGVQAVGEYLADKFQITHQFIDIDNPA